MISKLHKSFRKDFAKKPGEIQQRARNAYAQFQRDSSHPSLQFKRLRSSSPLWSVRISDSYRAVGIRKKRERNHLVLPSEPMPTTSDC